MKTVDQMRETFSRWKASGISLRAFGTREGISYSKLQYWRKRFRTESDVASGQGAKVQIVPVEVIPDERQTPAAEVIEVWLANGVSLSVPIGVDEQELRRLVGVLAAC